MKKIWIKLSAISLALTFLVAPLPDGVNSPLVLSADARDTLDSGTTASSSSSKPVSEVYTHKAIKNSIKKYAENNKDVKGWLLVPGTNISKPVAFSDKDNNYYSYRNIAGVNYPNTTYKNFTETATYLDFRTVLGNSWQNSSRNTVIYGHNWTNLRDPLDIGTKNNHIMFGQLPSYTNMDFAKKNPHIYFSTNENEGIWRVFCVAYVEISTSFNYNAPYNVGRSKVEDYTALLKEFQSRSMYDFDVDVKSSDRILTLSTCTRQYDQGSNQRFVVVARLLRDGETEKDTVKVTVNQDMKKPVFK